MDEHDSSTIQEEFGIDSSSPCEGDMLARSWGAPSFPSRDSSNTKFADDFRRPKYFLSTRLWTKFEALRNNSLGGGYTNYNSSPYSSTIQEEFGIDSSSPCEGDMLARSWGAPSFPSRDSSNTKFADERFWTEVEARRNISPGGGYKYYNSSPYWSTIQEEFGIDSSSPCEGDMLARSWGAPSFPSRDSSNTKFADERFWTEVEARRNISPGGGYKYYNSSLYWEKMGTVLPISRKDLSNTSPSEENSWKTFLILAGGSVTNIPPNSHSALVCFCISYLLYQARKSTDMFDWQFGNSAAKTSSQSLLNLWEACTMFFPEMAHTTIFMLSYLLTLVMIWRLDHLGVRIVLSVLVIISAPLQYFPALVRRASGIDVVCGGSVKLPLSRVTILGAFGLSVIFVLVTSFVNYFVWKFIHKGRLEGDEKFEVCLDDLYDDLDV